MSKPITLSHALWTILRIKHLKWYCLLLFCAWFMVMLVSYSMLISYSTRSYTDWQRLSPLTLIDDHMSTQSRAYNDLGMHSNVGSSHTDAAHSQSIAVADHDHSDPTSKSMSVDAVYALLARLLQQKSDPGIDLDIDTIISSFEFHIGDMQSICHDDRDIPVVYGCYRVTVQPDLVRIDGTDALSVVSGLNYYMNHYWLLSVSWTGNTLQFLYDDYVEFIQRTLHTPPSSSVAQTSGRRHYKHTYYKNVCTDSYTMAFWTWTQWEPHIDWMAMNNVNLLLLPTLNELIEYVLYTKHFKLSHSDLHSYFVGPAFLAWFRMGNLKGWPPRYDGRKRTLSLSKHWFDAQLMLVKQIMARCNELGIDVILSSFSGHVPEKLLDLYPNSNFYVGSIWYGFSSDHTQLMFLDCADELYVEIGRHYQRIQYNILKSLHYFEQGGSRNLYLWLDQFNELLPQRWDVGYLQQCGANQWQSLQLSEYVADPGIHITWVLQGWMFVNERRFWVNDRIHAYLHDSSNVLILDLIAEKKSIALETQQFFQHNYIWCLLHNFGGNYYLSGNLRNILQQLQLNQQVLSQSPFLQGIGISMEGIDNNEILYRAVLQQSYNTDDGDGDEEEEEDEDKLDMFVTEFMASRFGKFIYEFDDRRIARIYSEFVDIVYRSYLKKWGVTRSLIVMRPSLELVPYRNASDLAFEVQKRVLVLPGASSMAIEQRWRISQFQSNYIDYHYCALHENWREWMQFMSEMCAHSATRKYLTYSPTFANDVAEITRQMLSDLFLQLYSLWRVEVFKRSSERETMADELQQMMIGIIDDTDALLGYFEHYRLDEWLYNARAYGADEDEKDYFEMNARNLITRWGPNAEITEYASREWHGLMSNYYRQRWIMFFNGARDDELDAFEIEFQHETVGDLKFDDTIDKKQVNDFAAFYETLKQTYKKYNGLIDCEAHKNK